MKTLKNMKKILLTLFVLVMAGSAMAEEAMAEEAIAEEAIAGSAMAEEAIAESAMAEETMAGSAMADAWMVQTVPNPRNTNAKAYVANPDNILTEEDIAKLDKISSTLYQYTGVELVTVVLDDIGDATAFDFSYDLFNLWGIGDKDKNTGVMLFLAVKSREVEIRTGGGMEGLLTDYDCGEILDNDVLSFFRQGDWGGGLVSGATAIYDALTTDDARAELLLGYKPAEVSESPWDGLSLISLLLLLLALIVHFCRPKCPHCAFRDAKCKNTVEIRPTYTSKGAGTHHYTCRHCGHEWAVPYTIAKLVEASSSSSYGGGGSSRSYGGSSRGSFGGGRSYGGGAGRRF
ncbi:MAG: TPM domain-containing protein [Paludibacteraceae bacterium]|nr:TPM domain-containing protein [Paludibacteraceae bacterium]